MNRDTRMEIQYRLLKLLAEEYEEIKRQIAALTLEVEAYGFRLPEIGARMAG